MYNYSKTNMIVRYIVYLKKNRFFTCDIMFYSAVVFKRNDENMNSFQT